MELYQLYPFKHSLALTVYSIGNWAIKKEICVNVFNFGIVTTLFFFMLMSPYGNVDNNTFYPTTDNSNYYLQSELAGSNFFSQNSMGSIYTDAFHSHTYFIDDSGNIQKEYDYWKPNLKPGILTGMDQQQSSEPGLFPPQQRIRDFLRKQLFLMWIIIC